MSTIVTRSGKGTALTHTEVDANFTNLNADKAATADVILATQKGAASGVCPLDATSKILATYLPSYVDDVLEYANLAALPVTGETGKIYVALDTNKTYRWSGSAYIYITSGAVDSVAGRTGIVVLTSADVGLANASNTSDANKPVSTATQTALDLKSPLASPTLSNPTYTGTLTGSTGILNIGLGQVYKDASGNVGIGTTSPAGKLHVSGGRSYFAASSEPFAVGARYSAAGSSGTVYFGATDATATPGVQISAATGAALLTIDSSGNVGIGTSSLSNGVRTVIQGTQTGGAPQTSGTAQTYGLLRLQGTSFTSVLDFGTNGGNYNWIQATDSANLATNYSLALNPNGGNVGIGTSSPANKLTIVNTTDNSVPLSVAGSSSLIKDYGPSINFQYGSGAGQVLANIKGAWDASSSGAFGNLIFSTRRAEVVTEAMRIDSSGNVGIGTTGPKLKTHIQGGFSSPTTSGTTPTGTFLLDASAGGYGLYAGIYGSGTYGPWLQVADKNGLGLYGDIVINPLGGNVGIGTTPSTKLTVAGAITITGAFALRGSYGAGAITTNFAAGDGALASNTTGSQNTASGMYALNNNTAGSYNTASGRYALVYNTTGNYNTAIGRDALYNNTTGSSNTASGVSALYNNTTGNNNTASGMQALDNNTTGNSNTAIGMYALFSNTTGNSNTASGMSALLYNTTGTYNTASGQSALYNNTTGTQNTASGMSALFSNTTGNYNTASGQSALYNNTTGSQNTAIGRDILYNNTTGSSNSAIGVDALHYNTTGNNNTASGVSALQSNTTGSSNTASGMQALKSNTTGNSNTASGLNALVLNTTGNDNTASGKSALYYNTTGNYNTASGMNALFSNTTGSQNTASGVSALYYNTTGNYNTASGMNALSGNTTGSNNTAIGMYALQNNTTGICNTASGGYALYNNTTGSGNTAFNPLDHYGNYAPVFNPTTENNRFCMGSTGVTNAYIQVAWTVVSDARDKTSFAPVPHGLDFVNQLQPTAYQFKEDRETDVATGIVRYGFKAQDILALEGDTPVIIDTEDLDKLRFNSDSLIPVLVNAIKELTARLELLEGK